MAGSVVSAARWALLSGLIAKVVPPLFMVALARILAPADFGLMALATVVISLVALFQDLGLRQVLVQRRELTRDQTTVLFWIGVALGWAWWGAVYLSAPFWAGIYRQEEVTALLRVLGCLFLISPLGMVHETLLSRELAFSRLFLPDVAQSFMPGLVAVVLGLAGIGVWSLVWGALAGAALRVLLLWRAVSWRPAGLGSLGGEAKTLFGFGGWVSLEGFLGWGITYSDQAIAGRFLSTTSLGFYRLGVSVALMPAIGVSQVLARVLFPAFSRVQGEPAQVRGGFERALRLTALLMVPLGVGLCAFADPLVPVLLGERWRPSVDVVRILAVVGVLSALVNVAPPLYRAVGRVGIMPRFFMARLLVSVPAYWYGAQRGLTGLALTHLALTLCFAPVNLGIAIWVFQVKWKSVALDIALPALFAVTAALAGHLAGLALSGAWIPLSLAVQGAVFAIVYGLLLRVFARNRHDELLHVARSLAGA